MSNIGKVAQVIGPVVDVSFTGDNAQLPRIYDALHIDRGNGNTLVLEVQQHLGESMVRTIAMDSTDGLTRGAEAVHTGLPISVPTGDAVRGR